MSEAIVFTSGKGGVGKTTTIANVGTVLSQLDKKVIMIDTDLGLRNLDIVMGLEQQIRYNLRDLLEEKCSIKQAVIRDRRFPGLSIIPGTLSISYNHNYENKFIELIKNLKNEFDYCLIDCPAGIGQGFQFAISAVDSAFVVTTPSLTALIDAERIIKHLQNRHIYNINVILNEYNYRMVRRHEMLSINDVEAFLGIKPLGIVPLDKKIVISQNNGFPVVTKRARSTNYFYTIASSIADGSQCLTKSKDKI